MSESDSSIIAIEPFVNHWMGDAWRQDSQLLDKLFPLEPIPNQNYQKARKKFFNEDKRYKRWKGISADPKLVSRLYTPLTFLLNGILDCYGMSIRERLFMDTHSRHRTEVVLSPGIWLSGIGKEFAGTSASVPRAVWASCISVLEVVLDSDDLTAARNRLMIYMHYMFRYQDNRKFAFGLVVTQNVFIVYMFDHSGAVASDPCNYHKHPDIFCTVISVLGAGGDRAGFDVSVYRDGKLAKIRTLQTREEAPDSETEVEYVVKDNLFHFESLVERGTVCWAASLVDDPQSEVVIKDAWIAPSDPPGQESQVSLLRHAQSCGVVLGVVQILHSEDVRRSAEKSDVDSVLRNRRAEPDAPEALGMERVHIRMVMSPLGKTLDHFGSREELLFAFHDTVVAHRKLHDVAGILHRDISVRNILINPSGVAGNRGFLIDFDHSIRIGDTSPYSKKTRIGTRRYMSRNALEARHPHTYLDDLESFYYVFVWILAAYERPATLKAQLPNELKEWDEQFPLGLKYYHIHQAFELPISPWFGDTFSQLAIRLHDYFSIRQSPVKALPPFDPKQDYDEFIGYINQAIIDLTNAAETQEKRSDQGETPRILITLSSPIDPKYPVSLEPGCASRGRNEEAAPSPSQNYNDISPVASESTLRRRRRRRRLAAEREKQTPRLVARPRRSTANYDGPWG